jgi:Na+/H+ antiporter NhaD/arsenite permease-like protein
MILILILVLDAFNGMPRWWRPILSGILTIMMTTLFAMNIGTQHWLIDIFDVVMASFFTLTYWLYDRNNERVVQEYEDDQTLTRADRLKWFGYWIALIALLVGMLLVQAPYMPKKVLENARVMAQ